MEDLYPSRVYDKPKIIKRKDPVLFSDPQKLNEGPLNQQQLHFYEKNGFLLLDHFFSLDEVNEIKKELDRVWDENKHNHSQEVIREPNSDEIRSHF